MLSLFWKLNRHLWGYRLGSALFFQPAADAYGQPVTLRRFLGPLNQHLTERGWCPPWIMTADECEAYWRSRSNSCDENRPSAYATKDLGIIRFLHDFWSPEVRPDATIVELGCNCGANLEGLRTLGYRHLAGVEFNVHALDEMKRAFPELARIATLTMMSIDEYLRTAPTNSVDVIYTMAVAHHIHPSRKDVFNHMVRVARHYVCVTETEVANCTYQFARNFKRVFERLGCREIRSVIPIQTGATADYAGFVARLFAVPR